MSRLTGAGDTIVRCEALDSLDLPPPGLMKIDVEGAELDLIAGARTLIERHHPAIFMSLHIDIPAAQEVAIWFRSLGYSVKFSESAYDLIAVYPDPKQ